MRMTRGVIGRIVLGIWLGCITAAAQLPPEVLVDKYLLQAQMLRGENDYKGALEAMDRVVGLQKEHELRLPEEFSFHYAQTALAAGSVQAAIDSANRYLAVAGREGKYYREALELLVNAERKLKKSAPDPVGSTLATPEIKPQRQAVPQSSLPVQKATAVQPVVDCRQWNTGGFFWKATVTVESVTSCLATGADPMAWSKRKDTPLHWAARSNENPAVIEALLKAEADPMARNKRKETPLHWAAEHNENPAVMEALFKAGADPMARSKRKDTPLHWAARYNPNPAVIEALLKAGADPMARDKWKNTTLALGSSVQPESGGDRGLVQGCCQFRRSFEMDAPAPSGSVQRRYWGDGGLAQSRGRPFGTGQVGKNTLTFGGWLPPESGGDRGAAEGRGGPDGADQAESHASAFGG